MAETTPPAFLSWSCILPTQSLIILAEIARRFRPSPEQRFARQLRQAGHEVIFFATHSLNAGFSSHSDAETKLSKKKSSFDFLTTIKRT